MNQNAIPDPGGTATDNHTGTATHDQVGSAMDPGASPQHAAILQAIRFDTNGLVPAIAQQHDTGEVLMMAWMNMDAVRETLSTGQVCYFSRSRGRLWRKGESSGQTQSLRQLRVDCDGDTLLLLVDQRGVACHTGRRNCFFRAAHDGVLVEIAKPEIAPEALYGHAHG